MEGPDNPKLRSLPSHEWIQEIPETKRAEVPPQQITPVSRGLEPKPEPKPRKQKPIPDPELVPIPPDKKISTFPPDVARELDETEYNELLDILEINRWVKINSVLEGSVILDKQACFQLYLMWKGILTNKEIRGQQDELALGLVYDLAREALPSNAKKFIPEGGERAPVVNDDEVTISEIRIKKVKTINTINQQIRKSNSVLSKFIQNYVDYNSKLFSDNNKCRAIRLQINGRIRDYKKFGITDLNKIFK